MKALGLLGSRQQAHTVESLQPVISELRPMFPKAGVVEMKNILFHERQMKVPRSAHGVPDRQDYANRFPHP